MHARSLRYIDHAVPHEEPVEVDGGGRQSELGQLQHDADLGDEIDTFAATSMLRFNLHTVKLGWRTSEFFICEEPLGLRCVEDGIRLSRYRQFLWGMRRCRGHDVLRILSCRSSITLRHNQVDRKFPSMFIGKCSGL
jgi:hypothetical protein